MSSSFSFPILSGRDIVAILADSQIANISENDLINPTHDLAFALYSTLLGFLDSLQEDHGQVDFGALEHLENPDLHLDSVRIMNLYNKIREVVGSVSCPVNFTLKDLIRPNTQRTSVFISAILNFCLHKETKMNLLRPIVDEVSLLDERRRELEARISQLNAEIADYKEAKEREQPFVQEVDAKVKELHQTIQGLNNHQMSLKASFRTMREKAKEIDEKISSAEFGLVQSVQENANLRSKIVQSPDKLQVFFFILIIFLLNKFILSITILMIILKYLLQCAGVTDLPSYVGALEEKKSIRVEAKNSEKLAMQSVQEKTAIAEVYSKACKKMTKHFTQMQAIQEQVNSAKSIDKDVKVLKVKLSDDGVLDMSLEAKLVERQGKADQLEESRKALEKERDLKLEEVTKELNNVKSEVESKRRGLEARQRKVEVVVAEVDNNTLKINSVKDSGAATQQELGRKCEEIVKEFHNYSGSFGVVLPRIEAELVR
ncbi:hypothetical protein HHK36_009062 [Tetracentron sinense]|uniref:Kinetochore protein Nuf2 N-terminal domain-containing protein n=1 Tax=Tetracentron sinense TaxID=13715 RepID=A0A834ZI39_TETSI|nr:hypothetical protein HHK36_009062 [Tetracentron sinense]